MKISSPGPLLPGVWRCERRLINYNKLSGSNKFVIIPIIRGTLGSSGFKNDFKPSRLYLNMQPTVTSWSSSGDEFSLVWDQCPLSEWVEMPGNNSLKYCALIPGAIRGALQMVQLDVQCWFVQVNYI